MFILRKGNKTRVIYADRYSVDQLMQIVVGSENNGWDIDSRHLYKFDRSEA